MTIPANLPTVLTDLQALQCWPETHGYVPNDEYGYPYQFEPGDHCENFNEDHEMFTPWLTSLAMHLLPQINHALEDDRLWFFPKQHENPIEIKHNNTPQSIAVAIIQAAHATLVEEKS